MNLILSWFERKRARLQSALEQSIAGSLPKEIPLSESEKLRKQAGMLLTEGHLDEAFELLTRASRLNPSDALCFSNMGFIHAQRGETSEAMVALRKTVELDPENYDAYFMMGTMLASDGDLAEGLESLEKALSIKPDFNVCRDALCSLLARERKFSEARYVLQSGFAYETDLANYHAKSANLHYSEGDLKKAGLDFEKALKFQPNDVGLLADMAGIYLDAHEVGAAIIKCQQILALQPQHTKALSSLGVAYLLSGKYELAVEYSRKAMEIDPSFLPAHQNLIYMLSFGMSCSPEDYLVEAAAYGDKVSKLAKPYSEWNVEVSEERNRPLRVGMVSGDLHLHPVGYFLESILQHMDPEKVACIAYSSGVINDELTTRIRPYFFKWNDVHSLSDQDLAKMIHKDAIDILIDLSGHTQFTRLPMFAWRPAPIQISWLGFWASTGVKEIDYILVDEISAPRDEQHLYLEKLWYLPATRLCLTPPVLEKDEEMAPPPVCRNGFITFGSYQGIHKITDKTLKLWARVMSQIPNARLRLQSSQLSYPETRNEIRERLTNVGIDPERVQFHGFVTRQAYLASYAEVDMVLDTFPYPGGTTTAEALWMGVPTVTLPGKTVLSRQGVSMLSAVGLQQYIAENEDAFVTTAVKNATDIPRLVALRRSLRGLARQSALFDAPRFSNDLADCLWSMKMANEKT